MKKLLAVTMSLLLLGCMSLTAFAQDAAAVSADVYVTLANMGELVVTQEKITVTDIDNDATLTINDALYAAHEAKYEGGATAGYASAVGAYGLSLNKLWGNTNQGSFGYYVNNASAWSLTDPVVDGDHVYAFAYADAAGWSDQYAYFSKNTVAVEGEEDITLTLYTIGYDAANDYAPIQVPVEGATITVDGEETQVKTDAQGVATIRIAQGGKHLISAVSEAVTLVPAVCVATVSVATTTVPSTTTTVPPSTTTTVPSTTATTHTEKAPQTGEHTAQYLLIALAAVLSGAAILAGVKRCHHAQ